MDEGLQDYVAAVPQHRKQKVDMLYRLIMEMSPRAVVDMNYRMPTCRVGDDGWVAVAATGA
ncbi:MAG: hypothetical protein OEO19_03375 [Gammaproteobacteria bacterium]|nr:hypothetical protein [Gammaproteobacteria bacterium]MDH3449697.1 hypothetical protein [Gammaproteobacteria bacterium]